MDDAYTHGDIELPWKRPYPVPITAVEEASRRYSEPQEDEWNRYRRATSTRVEYCGVCGVPIEPRQVCYLDKKSRRYVHLHCRPKLGV